MTIHILFTYNVLSMILKKKFLIFSLLVHFILLIYQQKTIVVPSPKIVSKLKIKSINRNILKKRQTNSNFALFSKLSVTRSKNKFEIGAKIAQIDSPMTSSEGNAIYSLVNENLTFPKELSAVGVQGYVFVEAYFDEKGYFHEDKSIFSFSNKLLSIHVRQVLRKSLSKRIYTRHFKSGHYRLNFSFQITSTDQNLSKEKFKTGDIDFSRSNYGVVTKIDEVNHSLNKVLTGVTNWLSLLEYLPKNQEAQRSKILLFLENLKKDKKW